MAEMAAAAWAAVKAASAYVVGSMKAVAAGTATAGQVATYVAVTVGGSMAMSAAAQALMKPNVGGRAPGEWVADPNAGIPFAIGPRIGVGGNIVYKNTWGKDNEYKGIVSVVSGAGPITGYLGFTADKEAVTFSGDAATGRYSGQMWMRRTMGNQPDVALSDPSMPGWGANYKLSGKASFLWVLKQDSKFSVYPQGEPSPIHVVSGIKGYDPRFDDTFPGGSGTCRLGVPATYRTITNPIIADLNWCLGLKENGKVVGGLGASPAAIHRPAYTRAANIADANGWVVAALPRSDEPKSEIRAAFLQAGGAVISRQAGLISCVSRGAPKSPIMTISAADTAGPIELDTAANVLNRLNQITPRYLSEAHDWQLVAAAPVTSSVYLAEDRGRVRSDQRDYPYVPSAKQAAELAALDLANSREGIAGRWPLKAFCRDLEPGDVFTVDEPGMLLDGMDFLVLHREFEPAMSTVYVTFVSETAGKVDWALGRTPNPPPTPALSARVDLSPPAGGDWSVSLPTPVPGNVQVPMATITISIDNARAESLIVEKGPSATGPWRLIKDVAINGSALTVPLHELAPNEVFWLALSYRASDTGLSVRDVKGPFTAGNLVAGDTTHLKGEPVQDVLDRLVGVEAISASNEAAVEDLEEVFGDTVSAAQSAAEAAAAAANAITAKADAIIASSDAEGFSTAASDAATAAAGDAASALSSKNAAATSASNAATSASNASGHASTASTQAGAAAASATDAANRATAAAGSATTASTKATEAGNSASAANAAKVSAESARDAASGSASAASGSASSAATSATNAGTSATAANNAKTAAETARGQAQTFASNASNAATSAEASASTASTQAGLATTARNQADGFASAAQTSRNQASSFADAAGISAGASQSSAVTASTAAGQATAAAVSSIPATISSRLWTHGTTSGQGADRPDLLAVHLTGATFTGVTMAGPKQRLPWSDGAVYELRSVVSAPSGAAAIVRHIASQADSDFGHVTWSSVGSGVVTIPAGETAEVKTLVSLGVTRPGATRVVKNAAAAWVSFAINNNVGGPGIVRSLTVHEMTAKAGAEDAASAAATSASDASASMTAAGSSASAAQTARTGAETARGQAQTAATNAAGSATNAAGSASSASTSASNAATSRDQASGFATAASGSASTASTKATEAGNSATAANASKVAAESARDGAASSAAAAVTSASTASTKATEAGNSASAAEGAATRAETAESQALTYRNQASSAKDDAVAASVSAGTSAQFALGGALATFPPVVAPEYWTLASSPGLPAERPNIGASTVSNGRYVGTALCGPKQRVQWLDQRVIELSAEVHNPNTTPSQFAFAAFRFTEALTYLTWNTVGPIGTIQAGETVTYTIRFVMGSGVPGAANFARNDAVWVGFGVRNNLVSGNTPVEVGPIVARDVTSEVAAQAHAATALTQSSIATDAAAEATLNANLAAALSTGSINQNPAFTDYPSSATVPATWSIWGSAGTTTRVSDASTGNSVQQAVAGAGTYGLSQLNIPASPEGEWVVLEADFQRQSGTFVGATIEVQARNVNTIVKSSGNINIRDTIGTPGTIGAVYRVRRLIDLRGANITRYQIYLKARSAQNDEPLTIRWNRALIRPATAEEIAAGTVLPNVEAQLAITAAVAADAQTRLSSVAFNVTGGAGGDPFDVNLTAGPNGSAASLTATKIRLRNVVNNQVIDALIVEGGKARFGSNVEIAGNLVVAGSIDTPQLKNGAVSKGASAASTASTSVGLNTWTDLLSVAMTTAGGEVSIDFGAQVSVVNSQGPNAVVEVRFMRGSTVLETMQIMDVLGAQTIYVQGSMDPFQTYVQINSVVSTYIHPFTVDTGAPAGSHTWKVQMRSQAGATVGAKKMRLQEMKR